MHLNDMIAMNEAHLVIDILRHASTLLELSHDQAWADPVNSHAFG